MTAEPDSITALFFKPYRDWEKPVDIPRMVEHYRAKRITFGETEKAEKKAKPAKIAKEDLTGKNGADLLGLLGLSGGDV